jgi:hypothetical protein
MGTGALSLGREVDYSSSNAEVMNEGSCNSTFPVYLHGKEGKINLFNLHFYIHG